MIESGPETTTQVRSVKYEANQSRAASWTLKRRRKISSIVSWSMVSNAALQTCRVAPAH